MERALAKGRHPSLQARRLERGLTVSYVARATGIPAWWVFSASVAAGCRPGLGQALQPSSWQHHAHGTGTMGSDVACAICWSSAWGQSMLRSAG